MTLHADARPSQCSRVLAVLADGRAHTTSQIHAVAGTMRLNSRVAELRTRGYVIECHRIGPVTDGPDAYEYRLVSTPSEALGDAA